MKAELKKDDFGRLLPKPVVFSLNGRARKIEGGFRSYEVRNYATIVPSNSKGDKVAFLQDLEFDDGSRELRLCYYIIGQRGRMSGKWAWGQFALFIPKEDLLKLVEKGKEKGIV